MNMNMKVAGTSFHPLPEGQYVKVKQTYEFENVPCADVDAILMPEPENPYDPDAVKVLIPLESGAPFCIGYVPKDHPIKLRIKAPYQAVIMIKNFALNNPHYSPSWIVTEVIGL